MELFKNRKTFKFLLDFQKRLNKTIVWSMYAPNQLV
jgi:hypothetical protein